jgi:hypothetical protein
MDKKLLDLTILIPGDQFTIAFLNCFKNTMQAHPEIKISLAYESIVYGVRDKLLGFDSTEGISQKPKIDTKYILWIDSDCLWSVKDIETLYDAMETTGHYMISGWTKILGNQNRFSPFFLPDEHWGTSRSFRGTGKRLCDDDLQNLPEIFQSKIVGNHFLMERTDLYHELNAPWYAPYTFSGYGMDNLYSGEDSSKCLRAYEKGIKCYVHQGVKVGHEKMHDITGIH